MNQDDLEDWALRTMQALQDICDEAQAAAGNPDGEDQALDIRALMLEYEQIAAGRPAWQAKLAAQDDHEYLDIPDFLRRGDD